MSGSAEEIASLDAKIRHNEIAKALSEAGRFEEALARVDRLIKWLGDPADPVLRVVLAEAMAEKASALSELAVRRSDGITMSKSNWVCEDIVKRFGGDEDPELIRLVEWAISELPPKRRLRPWRR